MVSSAKSVVVALALCSASVDGFTVGTTTFLTSQTVAPAAMPALFMAEGFRERGVSVDQDGKSNVWAIEPKVEVSMKSAEEQTSSLIAAGGILAAVGAVAAIALSNLPDPSQY
jgi:hypothetical protein